MLRMIDNIGIAVLAVLLFPLYILLIVGYIIALIIAYGNSEFNSDGWYGDDEKF